MRGRLVGLAGNRGRAGAWGLDVDGLPLAAGGRLLDGVGIPLAAVVAPRQGHLAAADGGYSDARRSGHRRGNGIDVDVAFQWIAFGQAVVGLEYYRFPKIAWAAAGVVIGDRGQRGLVVRQRIGSGQGQRSRR